MTRNTIIACIAAVALSAPGAWWVRGLLEADRCLDAGGQWKAGLGYCENGFNPLEIAEAYARTHGPEGSTPVGLERQWWVEDHGDIWIVELGKQGHAGGGIRMAIRKRGGKVLGHDLTQ